ncbi:MAG: ABC transporter ATP-binding protein [Flavobacteriales bacterium]
MSIVLQTKHVDKFFYDPTEFQVLKNISFEVQKGEFLSMIGKSGSGKSTLLYILSTMDTNYSGDLWIDGAKMTGLSIDALAEVRNQKIGFVFQFHYLLPEFSCLKNVMIPALKLNQLEEKEIEDRAYEKLKMLGLADQAMKPANKLSGGQQQRVAIARALINDPLIIMGDEPTGNLDSKNTSLVFDILQDLTRTFGQTIIAVTHDDDFARKSDRIIEMRDGEIIH